MKQKFKPSYQRQEIRKKSRTTKYRRQSYRQNKAEAAAAYEQFSASEISEIVVDNDEQIIQNQPMQIKVIDNGSDSEKTMYDIFKKELQSWLTVYNQIEAEDIKENYTLICNIQNGSAINISLDQVLFVVIMSMFTKNKNVIISSKSVDYYGITDWVISKILKSKHLSIVRLPKFAQHLSSIFNVQDERFQFTKDQYNQYKFQVQIIKHLFNQYKNIFIPLEVFYYNYNTFYQNKDNTKFFILYDALQDISSIYLHTIYSRIQSKCQLCCQNTEIQQILSSQLDSTACLITNSKNLLICTMNQSIKVFILEQLDFNDLKNYKIVFISELNFQLMYFIYHTSGIKFHLLMSKYKLNSFIIQMLQSDKLIYHYAQFASQNQLITQSYPKTIYVRNKQFPGSQVPELDKEQVIYNTRYNVEYVFWFQEPKITWGILKQLLLYIIQLVQDVVEQDIRIDSSNIDEEFIQKFYEADTVKNLTDLLLYYQLDVQSVLESTRLREEKIFVPQF